MPCNLGVKLFEGVHARDIVDRLSIQPYQVNEPGEPIGRTDKVYKHAHLSFDVSDADFDQLPQQFADAVTFLAEHEADMRQLTKIGEAVLDFGHEPREWSSEGIGIQSDRLPQELVRLAAALDVQIELSLYLNWVGDEESAR